MIMHSNRKLLLKCGVLALAAATLATVLAALVFLPDAQPVGYVGQPAVSSSNVSNGNAIMYSIDYDASDWSGNVHAYRISNGGAIDSTDEWGTGGASAKVKLQSAADARFIVTSRPGGGAPAGIPFRWNSLSAGAGGQREALDAAGAALASSALLEYLRGSSANEGSGPGKYRARADGLGDIIHSTPVYWDDGVNRTVFVGANDGMMHALNAADGSERFAYVPAVLLPKLAALASPSYTHQYYVDGRLDVKQFGAQAILAGTLGGGGKAIFALDVTNATASSELNAAAKVLWEISNASSNFADLGDTYGAPTLFTMPDGRAALAIGNGYNNTGNGHAILYLIDAKNGTLIAAIDTGAGSSVSPNGLSSPALWDADGDGRKDTAYAGDIDGNLWKFNLGPPYSGTSVKTLYTNTAGPAQAITMAPGLLAHPLGGVLVEFVSGRMLNTADAGDSAEHYALGIWDGAPAANDTLLEQTLSEVNYTAGPETIRVRTATRNVPNWTPGAGHHKGWKTRLPIGGERVVGDGAFVTGNVFQFFSTNPTINPLARPPGENWWMQLNALSGGDSGTTLFDLNGDREFTSDDKVGTADPVGRHMGGGVRSQLIALSADGVDVFQSNYDKNTAPSAASTTTSSSVVGDRGVSGGHFDTDFFCYRNCGEATSLYRTVFASAGVYSVGRESGGATDGLNYVHVHEYDDIYDRVGINMLHPSQDLQRLALAKVSKRSGSMPDTPALAAANRMPDTGVTLVSTTIETGKTARSVPRASYNYADGPASAVPGYPTTVTDAAGTVITAKTRYTTTLTIGEAVNVGARRNDRYPYDWKRSVRIWDTVVTPVETIPNVRFKVLMANQAYSPAVNLRIAGAQDGTLVNATYNDAVYKFQATYGLSAAGLPTYLLADVSKLVFSMPLDAFNLKDWGTGATRAGLHPIRPQCAGVAVAAPTPGPLGEWRNGALTIQIVDASVADSDIELNVSGRPELGYRLRATSLKSKLLAEYLIYWHHPNNKCMGDTGWTKSPPQDTSVSDALSGVWAPGENDPQGVFLAGSGASTEVPRPPDPVTVVNADGSTTTTTVTHSANASGGYTITTTVRTVPAAASGTEAGIVTGGAVGSNGKIDTGGIDKNAANLGRINWRELQQ